MDMVINDVLIAENGQYPEHLVNSNTGVILICGCARNVFEDLDKAYSLVSKKAIVMGVNDFSFQAPYELHHAVSLHKEMLPAVKKIRPLRNLCAFTTHAHQPGEGIDNVWSIPNIGGTSSLFAVKVCMMMGFTKIMLCGVPLDKSGHYYDPPERLQITNYDGVEQDHVWNGFWTNSKIAQRTVRSFSGRTKKLFGEPTIEWLKE